MDKHQRRQLRKRDEKLGKMKELCAVNRCETENQKRIEVFEALRKYSGKIIPDFVKFCLEQEETHYRLSYLEWLWNMDDDSRFIWRPIIISERVYRNMIWNPIGNRKQQMTIEDLLTDQYTSRPYEEHICGKRVLVLRGGSINVRASILNGKQLLDKRVTRTHAIELLRTKKRTEKIRKELIAESDRIRSILNFKHIKEELMMAAWHPRRIDRILTFGGWDALDNFAGC